MEMTTSNDNTPNTSDQIIINEKLSALDELNTWLKDLTDFKNTIQEFHKRGKEIKKNLGKEMKQLKKNSKKKRIRKPDAKPGGFTKPLKISEQMCLFLGVDKGTMMARTNVSKKLNEWIRDNKLQYEQDRRIIIPNEALLKLFSEDYVDGCKLDFFTMQKYIKHHYIKD